MRFVCASRTHVGLRRALNEDRVLDRAECGLWVVADGMGGHDAGEVASAAVVEALAQIPAQADLETLAGSALEALQEVNSSLIELAKSGLPRRTIGTTRSPGATRVTAGPTESTRASDSCPSTRYSLPGGGSP